MTVRILQLTDCHLMADPLAELKGVCTRARFDAVLRAAREVSGPIERLILTGDMAHDESLTTYEILRGQLTEWFPKLRLIPGNHDDRTAMLRVFGERIAVESGRNVFVDVVGGWKLIGLDSQLAGELRGQIGREQLDWLDRELASEPNLPTALFLHHPPVQVGSAWLDQIGLEDAEPLLALISRCPQVRVVCCGHIHQELAVARAAVLVLATPSTGVQFQPESETLIVDSIPPGFRILDLDADGSVRTRVVRVPI